MLRSKAFRSFAQNTSNPAATTAHPAENPNAANTEASCHSHPKISDADSSINRAVRLNQPKAAPHRSTGARPASRAFDPLGRCHEQPVEHEHGKAQQAITRHQAHHQIKRAVGELAADTDAHGKGTCASATLSSLARNKWNMFDELPSGNDATSSVSLDL